MFLQGKRALITGSTSGIGLAIARALHAEGAEVVLSGFGDPAEIAKLCDELGARHIGGDLSKREGVEALMAGAGLVDVLVNNAGAQHVAPIEEFGEANWNKIIAINLSAAFHAMAAAIPGMKARKWGRIISTASAHSLVASPFKSAYVSAKHGIAGSLSLKVASIFSAGTHSGVSRDNYILFSRYYIGGEGILPRTDLAWGVAGKFYDIDENGGRRQ